MYITPLTKIGSTFTEAKEFFTEYGSLFDVENRLKIADLAQGKRNLIVGEPGIGKTFLLEQIKQWLDKEGSATGLISLRQTGATELIDEFLNKPIDGRKVLLLDALDEVRSSLFPSVLQKIEQVSKNYPELPIYLSSRWVFISRYATSFPEYRFITISPFTRGQVREYLIGAGRSARDVDALLNRVMSFSHRTLVIQVPRYLSYLDGFLKQHGVEAAAQVSRNELFEYFIYAKLELEDNKLITDKKAIIKRVLEKLAVTMEIYQSNTISKDELMTFFDDVKSDLKQVALSQISLDVFYGYSLLKVSEKSLDEIQFENTEFQEYLCAKEITRCSDPGRAAFSFAVDPHVKEIYPTWFNALTMVKRWESAYEVAPWLSDFFSSEDGKELIEAFRTESEENSLLDPEIIPFILICYVLPEPYWQKLPSLAERRRIARVLSKAAREIRKLSLSNYLGPSESTGGVVDQLARWADLLRGHPRLMISRKLHIIDDRPSAKSHRAKRRVVSFLDGYFRAIGRRSPPWKLITKLLKATKLVKLNAKEGDVDVASWWSDVKKRDRRLGKPLKLAQENHVQRFYEMKQMVSEGFEGTMVLKWEADV